MINSLSFTIIYISFSLFAKGLRLSMWRVVLHQEVLVSKCFLVGLSIHVSAL